MFRLFGFDVRVRAGFVFFLALIVLLYQDEFGHPERYITRTGQQVEDDMLRLWWWDPERIAATEKARADGKAIPQGQIDVRPWASEDGASPTG